eukprot:m.10100 g.10100  ORF g.10100 m.10100 type:complete len:424 (-) comp4270_c0_seq1:1348-2619(-)
MAAFGRTAEEAVAAEMRASGQGSGYMDFFQQAIDRDIAAISERVAYWKDAEDKYAVLEGTLSTLADKTRHRVMVPFGTKAFMPGELVHTNELMVLLGENYFAERSAKQAGEIAARRREVASSNHQLACREMERMQARRGFSTAVQVEDNHDGLGVFAQGDGCFDIREEYHSDEEESSPRHPRIAAAKGVADGSAVPGEATKAAAEATEAAAEATESAADENPNLDDFFARLAELEKQELAEGDVTVTAAGSDGGSESDGTSDDIDEQTPRGSAVQVPVPMPTSETSSDAAPKRTIRFKHTTKGEETAAETAATPQSNGNIVGPGDLYTMFGAGAGAPSAEQSSGVTTDSTVWGEVKERQPSAAPATEDLERELATSTVQAELADRYATPPTTAAAAAEAEAPPAQPAAKKMSLFMQRRAGLNK